jgi:hypothetical protein
MAQVFSDTQWTGHYLQGQTPAIMVRYKGPTGHRPSAWIATMRRDRVTTYRAVSSYSDGPIVAATKCLEKSELRLILSSGYTLDPHENVYVFGTSLR